MHLYLKFTIVISLLKLLLMCDCVCYLRATRLREFDSPIPIPLCKVQLSFQFCECVYIQNYFVSDMLNPTKLKLYRSFLSRVSSLIFSTAQLSFQAEFEPVLKFKFSGSIKFLNFSIETRSCLITAMIIPQKNIELLYWSNFAKFDLVEYSSYTLLA